MAIKKKYPFVVSQTTKHSLSKYPVVVDEAPLYAVHPYFSFRYYHSNHKDFTFAEFTKDEFLRFVQKLKDLSQNTWKQILIDQSKFWHAHKVDWSETTIPSGFSHLPQALKESPVYQFKVFEGCRVFGFFNPDNVFKIVWIDKRHKIYGE
jgi:hypothetical protein